MVFPWIVLLVSAAFGLTVFRQYQQRRRLYQLVWAISLAMAAAASLAYVMFLGAGHAEIFFRLYYILGALLMPIYLGMGSLLLAARSPKAARYARWCLYALIAASAAGIAVLLTNPIDQSALRALNGGPGTGVYGAGPYLLFTILFNTIGVAWVVGVAIYSGWQRWRRASFGRLVGANLLIALGDLTIGAAGSMARLGAGGGFWLTMAIGWVIIFSGFLLTFNIQRTAVAAASGTAPAIARS